MTDAITKKLDELEGLWKPHKKYPLQFVEYPEVNKALDYMQALINVARAADAFITRYNEVFGGLPKSKFCTDFEEALKGLGEL